MSRFVLDNLSVDETPDKTITVRDLRGSVEIALRYSEASYRARMTPPEARMLANSLLALADVAAERAAEQP